MTFRLSELADAFRSTPEEIDQVLYLAGFDHIYEPDGDRRYPSKAVKWLVEHLPTAADVAIDELHVAAQGERERLHGVHKFQTIEHPQGHRFEQ